ncbi:hypothetical protein B9Z55_025368 [Caenorhabditis nigoni]|uniref:Uncharacterized protein n=1 Tax=Caenorhabditis nigoni TaxID=1611254 RepID=A0A2G5SYW0_9PELO|nr:hypothetical protein B9Z55_025368 [Caenorhabditis nigoni]
MDLNMENFALMMMLPHFQYPAVQLNNEQTRQINRWIRHTTPNNAVVIRHLVPFLLPFCNNNMNSVRNYLERGLGMEFRRNQQPTQPVRLTEDSCSDTDGEDEYGPTSRFYQKTVESDFRGAGEEEDEELDEDGFEEEELEEEEENENEEPVPLQN